MYSKDNVYLNDSVLVVNSDEYHLSKILDIQAKELRLKDHLIRLLSISIALSVVGWVIFPIIAPLLMVVGAFFAVLTSKKYELRAEFRGVDESGDHWTPLARGKKHEEFVVFKDIVQRVNSSNHTGYKAC